MTPQILLLLCLLAVALALFWWERISSEVVALGLLLALAFTGLLPKGQAFAGFGSDTVIMILGLLILTAALERTGVVELAGRAVLSVANRDGRRASSGRPQCGQAGFASGAIRAEKKL